MLDSLFFGEEQPVLPPIPRCLQCWSNTTSSKCVGVPCDELATSTDQLIRRLALRRGRGRRGIGVPVAQLLPSRQPLRGGGTSSHRGLANGTPGAALTQTLSS